MPSYYFHFVIAGKGSGNIVIDTELPLSSQDLKGAKGRIQEKVKEEAGLDVLPEMIDLDFIFELSDGKEEGSV